MLQPGTLANFEQEIRNSLGKPKFDLWFGSNTRFQLEEGWLEVGVPNLFYREWLESHFQDTLRRVSEQVFGCELPIRFRIDPTLFRRIHSANEEAPAQRSKPKAKASQPTRRPHRFDLRHFVVGATNRVAHAAVSALIENPRQGYSPLVLFGGIGLGKTHLVKAAEFALKERHPDLKVLALSCEEFTNDFVESMKLGRSSQFRKKVRHLDVLIVDDIQFLCGKRATQEEFFHTVNALEARGGKLLVTCGVHPRKLTKVQEEIKSRLVSGMVARLEPPNRDMRRQVLAEKGARKRLALDDEVLDYLASQLRGHMGELEGALNYLEHYAETMATPLTVDSARSALAEILRHNVPVLRVNEVLRRACDVFGVSPKSIKERRRARTISHPRMLVLYLARKYTPATYSEIGEHLGGFNHSSVIAAERKINQLLDDDGEMALGERPWKVRDAVEAFERELGRNER